MALVPSSYLRWEAIDKTSARAVITGAEGGRVGWAGKPASQPATTSGPWRPVLACVSHSQPAGCLCWIPTAIECCCYRCADAGLTASAVFRFNALGQIVGMRTTDARSSAGAGASSSGGAEAGDLVCYYRHYAVMGGHHPMRVPTEVEVGAALPACACCPAGS